MNILGFESLPSTNTYAKENFVQLHHNDIILAANQTDGKGRKGRKWSSQSGGVYFSLIQKPYEPDLIKLASATQVMAMSVCKTIRSLGANAYIKWPNDVLFEGKKFCGVLSEAIFNENNVPLGSVIGVGINVDSCNIDSNKPFTTLENMGIKVNKTQLIDVILTIFETFPIRNFRKEFISLCPSFKKEVVLDGRKGVFEDIDNGGRMIFKTDKGLEIISAGDIEF